MKSRLAFCICVLLVPALAAAGPITALYVVGDSLSDQGNAFTLTGGFPAVPYAQRASNGPVAVERLASDLGVSLVASELGGTNHAVVGATTGLVPIPSTAPPALIDNLAGALYGQPGLFGHGMLEQASDIVGSGPFLDPAGSLFVVWGGANDLFLDPSPASVSTALGNLAAAIGSLYGAGARRFLVPNLPDLSQTPFAQGLPLSDRAGVQALTIGFNDGLETVLGALTGLPAISITPFDTFALLNAMTANPVAYGFTNASDPCLTGNLSAGGAVCASASTMVFWDSVHPTTAAHAVLGDAFAAAVGQPVPEPGTMVLVVLGVGVAIALRRRAL